MTESKTLYFDLSWSQVLSGWSSSEPSYTLGETPNKERILHLRDWFKDWGMVGDVYFIVNCPTLCCFKLDSFFIMQVGYYFAPSGKPYPDNWIITDIIYEFEGSLLSRQVSYNLIWEVFSPHFSHVPILFLLMVDTMWQICWGE